MSAAHGSAANPSVLSDVFARVGGPGSLDVRANVMMEVSASHVILDNIWLWRADHAEPWEEGTPLGSIAAPVDCALFPNHHP